MPHENKNPTERKQKDDLTVFLLSENINRLLVTRIPVQPPPEIYKRILCRDFLMKGESCSKLKYLGFQRKYINGKKPVTQRLSAIRYYLDGFRSFYTPDNAGYYPQHTSGLSRTGGKLLLIGIKVSITDTPSVVEHRNLSAKFSDSTIYIRLPGLAATIIYKITRRKIITSVYDNIIVLYDRQSIIPCQEIRIHIYLYRRRKSLQPSLGTLRFRPAYLLFRIENLTLQITLRNDIPIDESQPSDTGSGKLKSDR